MNDRWFRKGLRLMMALAFLPALMASSCPEFCDEFPEFCSLEEEVQAEQAVPGADIEGEVALVTD